MDPGSSAGRSEIDDKELERGRPGKGLCIKAELGLPAAHGAGERRRSLNSACRLDAAFVRATLYEGDRGLRHICLLSVVTILRSDGRPRPDFAVTFSRGLANHAAPQRICMQLNAQHPAPVLTTLSHSPPPVQPRQCAFASASHFLELSIRTFASTLSLDTSGLASMERNPPVR